MKKSNQTRKTRVTSQNRVAAGKSRKHNQKREGFSGIKEIFTPRRGKKLKTNRYMLQTGVIVVAFRRVLIIKGILLCQSRQREVRSSVPMTRFLHFQRTMKREMRFGIILMKICLRILLDIPVMEKRVLERSVKKIY